MSRYHGHYDPNRWSYQYHEPVYRRNEGLRRGFDDPTIPFYTRRSQHRRSSSSRQGLQLVFGNRRNQRCRASSSRPHPLRLVWECDRTNDRGQRDHRENWILFRIVTPNEPDPQHSMFPGFRFDTLRAPPWATIGELMRTLGVEGGDSRIGIMQLRPDEYPGIRGPVGFEDVREIFGNSHWLSATYEQLGTYWSNPRHRGRHADPVWIRIIGEE